MRTGKHQYAHAKRRVTREDRWWSNIERDVRAAVRRLEERGFFKDYETKRDQGR